jgi:hypothetical protein
MLPEHIQGLAQQTLRIWRRPEVLEYHFGQLYRIAIKAADDVATIGFHKKRSVL